MVVVVKRYVVRSVEGKYQTDIEWIKGFSVKLVQNYFLYKKSLKVSIV